jgi:hypothetical protein
MPYKPLTPAEIAEEDRKTKARLLKRLRSGHPRTAAMVEQGRALFTAEMVARGAVEGPKVPTATPSPPSCSPEDLPPKE